MLFQVFQHHVGLASQRSIDSRGLIEDEARVADSFVAAVFLGVVNVEVIGPQVRPDACAAFEYPIRFAYWTLGAQDQAFMPTPTQARPNLAFLEPSLLHYLSVRMRPTVRKQPQNPIFGRTPHIPQRPSQLQSAVDRFKRPHETENHDENRMEQKPVFGA
jgi:hypothetical protein